jgi:hypothetical protein
MGTFIIKLHSSWKWVILTKLQLSCNESSIVLGENKLYVLIKVNILDILIHVCASLNRYLTRHVHFVDH